MRAINEERRNTLMRRAIGATTHIGKKVMFMRRLTVLLALLTVFSLAIPTGAKTTRFEISGTQESNLVDPGEVSFSGPILHVRGQQVAGELTLGESAFLPSTGTSHAVVNFNLDTRTGNGRGWGEGSLDFGDGGFDTTFWADIRPADVPGGLLAEFEIVGHGYGSLEGTELRVTAQEQVLIGFATFEGVMFVPGDR